MGPDMLQSALGPSLDVLISGCASSLLQHRLFTAGSLSTPSNSRSTASLMWLQSSLNTLNCHPRSNASVTLQKDHSSLKQQADAQAAQVSDLKAELRGSMAECEQLEVRLSEKDRQQEALQQLVQQLQQQSAAAQQELAAAHSRQGRTQAEMAALEG